MQNKNINMDDILKSATGGNLFVSKARSKKLKASKDTNLIGLYKFPPSLSNLKFSSKKGIRFTSSFKRRLRGAVVLPEQWNNYTPPAGETQVEKYKLTTRPISQGSCGSCFSVATATAISDAFVFTGLPFNPNLSPMSILSCIDQQYGNSQCDGGSPIEILHRIARQGITASQCIDYLTICNKDPYCLGQKQASDSSVLNKMIPTCGCCSVSSPHYRYWINDDPESNTLDMAISIAYNTAASNLDSNIDKNAVEKIKEHLYKYGTCVTGFIVKGNFTGDKSDTPGQFSITKGIYIDTEDYSQNTDDIGAINGGHAICIVGWGIEKNVTIPSTSKTMDIPYWVCRNSWGGEWGFSGYFKFAMYQPPESGMEINEFTALERLHSDGIGGVILFSPGKIEEIKDVEKSSCSNLLSDKSLNEFYNSEKNPLKSNYNPVNSNQITPSPTSTVRRGKKSYIYYLVMVAVIAVIAYMILRHVNYFGN